ncbi:MAG: ankyrin repeat domain-containing protein [Leeuwenhoekiella sp.]
MKTIKKTLLILALFSCFPAAFAQSNNVFLDRSFWGKNPNLSTVKQEIAAGNDPTAFNDNAFDAVVLSILGKANPEVTTYLLSFEGNPVDKRTHDSRTYIFWAAFNNNTDIMKVLLKKGASLDVKDSHGYTPAAFAANGGQTNPEIYELFEENGVVLANEKNEAGANLLLLLAPNLESTAAMDYFIDKGIDAKGTDDKGNGIFNYAARKGNVDFLKELVAANYDYKTPNKEGGNAFLFAAQGGRGQRNSIEVFEYLKKLGLDPTVVTKTGESALHSLASRSSDKEVIHFFLDAGVNVDESDAEGNTPLLNAASRNTLEIVELVASQSKDLNAGNHLGQSPVMLAVENNGPEVVDFFLQTEKNPNALRDENGNTLAYYLVNGYSPRNTEQFEAKLKLLKAYKIDLNAPQNEGNTALHLAAKTNDLNLIKEAASWDIPINAVNDEGLTPLHIAAMKAHNDEILKFMIAQGADKNVKTSFEESVYDLASENELLKENEVSINFLN